MRIVRCLLLPAGATVLVAAVATVAVTVSPTSHDFGQVVLGERKVQGFAVTVGAVAGTPKADSTYAALVGADAPEFEIDARTIAATPTVTPTPAIVRAPTAAPQNCVQSSRTGSCQYNVAFHPTSSGRKSVTLVIVDTRGNRAAATLTGEGLLGCRPHLVSCNYADLYDGSITMHTVDSSVVGKPNGRAGRWETTIKVTITKGVATCTGFQDDWEEEYTGDRLDQHDTSRGPIAGDGLFAVEFGQFGLPLAYKLSVSCPTASLTHNGIDYLVTDSRGKPTESNGSTPANPAAWKHAAAMEPKPTSQLAAYLLIGNEKVLRTPAGDDVGGYSVTDWTLKRPQ